MNHISPWQRRVIIISAIIVGLWLIGLAIKLTGWLLQLLLPVAAIILILAVIFGGRRQPTSSKKEPLKISRDTTSTTKQKP